MFVCFHLDFYAIMFFSHFFPPYDCFFSFIFYFYFYSLLSISLNVCFFYYYNLIFLFLFLLPSFAICLGKKIYEQILTQIYRKT